MTVHAKVVDSARTSRPRRHRPHTSPHKELQLTIEESSKAVSSSNSEETKADATTVTNEIGKADDVDQVVVQFEELNNTYKTEYNHIRTIIDFDFTTSAEIDKHLTALGLLDTGTFTRGKLDEMTMTTTDLSVALDGVVKTISAAVAGLAVSSGVLAIVPIINAVLSGLTISVLKTDMTHRKAHDKMAQVFFGRGDSISIVFFKYVLSNEADEKTVGPGTSSSIKFFIDYGVFLFQADCRYFRDSDIVNSVTTAMDKIEDLETRRDVQSARERRTFILNESQRLRVMVNIRYPRTPHNEKELDEKASSITQ